MLKLIVLLASMAAAQPRTAPSHKVQSRTLRVVTLNIEYGAGGLDKVIKLLKQVDADIVALTEVDRRTARARKIDQLTTITRALSVRSAFAEHVRMPVGSTGVAILSRWPMKNAQTHVGAGRLATLDVDVKVDGRWVQVTVVHLFPTNPFENAAARARHDELRRKEAQSIEQRLHSKTGPLLVLGDFNDRPRSDTHQRFSEALGLTDACGKRALALTYPARFPVARIDYVFASRHFRVDRCDTLSTIVSDHRAVVAELTMPE